jgi:tetratricopeptide (TPR) repeat protein
MRVMIAAHRLARCSQLAWFAAVAACGAPQGPSAATPTGTAPAAAQPEPARRAFVSPYSYEWFVRAELYAATGRHAEAVAAYEAALTSADDDPYVLARLAEAQERAGNHGAAQSSLERALKLDPRSEAAWLARGRIAERRDQVAQALEAYERAESAAPLSPDAPLALAALLRRTSHPERASAVLARFAARSGRRPGAARSARDREHPDPERALEAALADHDTTTAEALLATTPPDRLGGPVAVAEGYLAIGRPDRALEHLEQTAESEEAVPHRRAVARARALLGLNQPAEAAALAARVPKASRHYAEARRTLIEALEAAGLPALAREVEAE